MLVSTVVCRSGCFSTDRVSAGFRAAAQGPLLFEGPHRAHNDVHVLWLCDKR